MCIRDRPGTPWGEAPPERLPDDDGAAGFYLSCTDALAARGYAQYEISNFAKPGFASRHNLLYWNCQHYLGLGPHAHSCLGGRRFFCPQGTAQFLAGPAAYQQDGICTREDYIMLQLRLSAGLSPVSYTHLFPQAHGVAIGIGHGVVLAEVVFIEFVGIGVIYKYFGHTSLLLARQIIVINGLIRRFVHKARGGQPEALLEPVSYTHLDVYKRQIWNFTVKRRPIFAGT